MELTLTVTHIIGNTTSIPVGVSPSDVTGVTLKNKHNNTTMCITAAQELRTSCASKESYCGTSKAPVRSTARVCVVRDKLGGSRV